MRTADRTIASRSSLTMYLTIYDRLEPMPTTSGLDSSYEDTSDPNLEQLFCSCSALFGAVRQLFDTPAKFVRENHTRQPPRDAGCATLLQDR